MMRSRWIHTGMFVLLMTGGLCVVAAGAIARVASVEGRPGEVTALEVSAPGPPRYVYGSDGREHVDYD
jgi:hypothetical protein